MLSHAVFLGDPPVDTDEPHVDTMETEDTPPITAPSAVFMEWHSCSICLEEMLDSDLLTHAECGGKVCGECLTSSKAHQESSGQKRISCPVSYYSSYSSSVYWTSLSYIPDMLQTFIRGEWVHQSCPWRSADWPLYHKVDSIVCVPPPIDLPFPAAFS